MSKPLNEIVTYDLSPEQLDAYEANEPMVLLIPLHASSPLGRGREADLIRAALKMLPDLNPADVDDVRPSHIWVDAGGPKPVHKTSLEDVFGTTLRPELAKLKPFVASVYVCVVSVNEGRAERVRGVWPGGAIRLEGDIFFPKSEISFDSEDNRKAARPSVDPDYFVPRDFGGPES